MLFTVPLDRARVVDSQKAFGRLRMLLRQQPVPSADVMTQARECGRCALAAEMRLDMMIDVLAGLPLPSASGVQTLSNEMITAAIEAYLVGPAVSVDRSASRHAAAGRSAA